ncbi:MAG: hypothetical protein JWN23_2426 [Rhodocyclales bacterium]|nr:hypothetical protein [Rhodocyclales bacterium]
MNLLIIEDEPDFVDSVKKAGLASDMSVFSGADLGFREEGFFKADGGSVEEQLKQKLSSVCTENNVDLVLLDSDLSRLRNGISQTACRDALQSLGIPVCRYSKGHTSTQVAEFGRLINLASDGASAIWVAQGKTQDVEGKLMPWLQAVSDGFQALRSTLLSQPAALSNSAGPAGILAKLIGHPELQGSLLGYTGPSIFFFGSAKGSTTALTATQAQDWANRLGYWLMNYVLPFPGPILCAPAAAAYLNITCDSLARKDVQQLLCGARYSGPFGQTSEYYLKSGLDEILETQGGDIALAASLKSAPPERIDAARPEAPAYYCVLSQTTIREDEAAPSPDWIPAGAQTARIKQEILDELGPMLDR